LHAIIAAGSHKRSGNDPDEEKMVLFLLFGVHHKTGIVVILMADIKADKILDARGLYCPMPVLKTKRALDEMGEGQILEVIASDPASRTDIPAFIERVGHSLIRATEETGVFYFLIRKI
jgi:tRNA 2-thiouridine synthesizing protein A